MAFSLRFGQRIYGKRTPVAGDGGVDECLKSGVGLVGESCTPYHQSFRERHNVQQRQQGRSMVQSF